MRRKEIHQPDYILAGAVGLLLILGILMVYSASSVKAAEKLNDSIFFLRHHAFRVGLGLIGMLLLSRVAYASYRPVTPLLLLSGVAALVIVLFMPEVNGSRRAVIIGGFQFQPSEFMKLLVIFYLAAIFAKGKTSPAHQPRNLRTHYLLFMGIVGLVLLEPDLGTGLVLFFIGLSVFLLAGVSGKRLLAMALIPMPVVLLEMAVHPYQRRRFITFIESVTGSGELSYHVKQSIIGLAHGGFSGVGYGAGKQKLFFLPEPFSDFILASLGEELGFIGIAGVFLLLAVVLWRGTRIALRAPDRYGFLLAGGITAMILINGLVNAAVVVNLLPTTGLPFPFISYGGSSLLAHLCGIGILLNISRYSVETYRGFTRSRGRDNNVYDEE
jgi:cell division protein FtsW